MEGRSVVAMGKDGSGRGVWGRDYKRGDDEYVHYLDCGNSFMNTYICQSIYQLYTLNMQFIVYQLIINEAL